VGPVNGAEQTGFIERIERYMHKTLREAKVHVSWMNPSPQYDEAVRGFIAALLDQSGPNEFLDDFLPFQTRVAELGIYNSLSQTVLRLAAPGVPEIYQGAELWELSLVDPDNRQPVDFGRLQAVLAELRRRTAGAGADLTALSRMLMEQRHDGRIKLHVVQRGLAHRRAHPELFLRGDYIPLEVSGDRSNHVCVFARSRDRDEVVVAVPRLLARLIGNAVPVGPAVWGEDAVVLPAGEKGRVYRNVFTGEIVETTEREGHRILPLAAVFSIVPVAVLERLEDA
jgi:(1->4)-alpha-D-glucan 1-alpha-D-glucosylmutase